MNPMHFHSRREFLKTASTAALVAAVYGPASRLLADPLGLPLGLQLYSVRELLPKDFAGTLKQIGALGYREVEAAGFFGHSATEVKQAMQAAGLRCVSAHYSSDDLHAKFDPVLAFGKELGLEYIICSFPGKDPKHKGENKNTKDQAHSFTLDDWRWNADDFNHIGEKVKAAGMQFGYHNHTMEFRSQDGVVPLDELIRLTDPKLVTIELDCGWVKVGGGDPVAYLRRYPKRISMLHIKDFKHTDKPASVTNPPEAAELGQGTIDYRPIFEAAKGADIKHYFVEQEQFDMPPMEALKIDADYIRKLKV